MEEKTVTLSLDIILRECSLDANLTNDHYYNFALKNRSIIHDVFKYKKFNDDFTSKLVCFRGEDDLIGTIKPSYDEFLDKLLTILNIKHNSKTKDDDKLTETMLERLEVLRKIKSEKELQEEFPLLYNDLIDGRKYYNDLQRLRINENITDEELASGEHYYYSCALKKSFHNFIETQSEMYRRYITDRKTLKEKQQATSYNNYIRKHFDLDKLYMYVMHEYLIEAEQSDDRQEIKKYITLVERYLESERDKSCQIRTNEVLIVDIENIKMRLENLKRKIAPESSEVNWVIIPEGTDDSVVRTIKKSRTLKVNSAELEQLKQIGERKYSFYESTAYLAKAIGLKKYRGYVAYIYENGEVILDCEYNKNSPRAIRGNAIYNLKIVDFENLSKLDKSVLIRHPNVGRIYHRKNWEEKVRKIIQKESTPEEKEETKAIVKTLTKKNS